MVRGQFDDWRDPSPAGSCDVRQCCAGGSSARGGAGLLGLEAVVDASAVSSAMSVDRSITGFSVLRNVTSRRESPYFSGVGKNSYEVMGILEEAVDVLCPRHFSKSWNRLISGGLDAISMASWHCRLPADRCEGEPRVPDALPTVLAGPGVAGESIDRPPTEGELNRAVRAPDHTDVG
jgi:hypothetical protein